MERDDTVLSAEEKDQQGELREKLRVVKTVLEQVRIPLGGFPAAAAGQFFIYVCVCVCVPIIAGAGLGLQKYHANSDFFLSQSSILIVKCYHPLISHRRLSMASTAKFSSSQCAGGQSSHPLVQRIALGMTGCPLGLSHCMLQVH